jgi:tRNA 5-methylaminomethyl-2-thiouridine biosynthesis bifunctional protein
MTAPLVPARLELAPDGTPVSERYGDVYHSIAGGHAQARHVFLGGNGLPVRWRGRASFSLFETGFGLGLNFMATWLAWRSDPQRSGRLEFISVEKHPFSAADLAQAHLAWPEFAPLSTALCAAWPELVPGEHRIDLDEGCVVLRLLFGDACEIMASLDASVDAIYLDGFSPAKNPELWSPAVCRQLARLVHPETTLATWSVAGSVRRALAAAGFEVARCPGFAGKRQMLSGRYVGSDSAAGRQERARPADFR